MLKLFKQPFQIAYYSHIIPLKHNMPLTPYHVVAQVTSNYNFMATWLNL